MSASEQQHCGRCGRYVAKSDRVAEWRSEPGEYGTVLSTWPVSCQHCTSVRRASPGPETPHE